MSAELGIREWEMEHLTFEGYGKVLGYGEALKQRQAGG